MDFLKNNTAVELHVFRRLTISSGDDLKELSSSSWSCLSLRHKRNDRPLREESLKPNILCVMVSMCWKRSRRFSIREDDTHPH